MTTKTFEDTGPRWELVCSLCKRRTPARGIDGLCPECLEKKYPLPKEGKTHIEHLEEEAKRN